MVLAHQNTAHAIHKLKPDMLVLNETRTNARKSNQCIWPAARVEQAFPQTKTRPPSNVGVKVAIKSGLESMLVSRMELEGERGKALIQTVVVKINETTNLAGIYVSKQAKCKLLESTLDKIRRIEGVGTIIVGDINARHEAWDKATKERGRSLYKWAKKCNLNATGTERASCQAKGGAGTSHPYLIIYTETVEFTQPTDGIWSNASEHLLIL